MSPSQRGCANPLGWPLSSLLQLLRGPSAVSPQLSALSGNCLSCPEPPRSRSCPFLRQPMVHDELRWGYKSQAPSPQLPSALWGQPRPSETSAQLFPLPNPASFPSPPLVDVDAKALLVNFLPSDLHGKICFLGMQPANTPKRFLARPANSLSHRSARVPAGVGLPPLSVLCGICPRSPLLGQELREGGDWADLFTDGSPPSGPGSSSRKGGRRRAVEEQSLCAGLGDKGP